ncbi:MAG: rhomboid family intramembrane serine protease [Acidobacteria bacterium]|nr:rhomboid family intramembrane serine protease [Acidobacteriota bacterium]
MTNRFPLAELVRGARVTQAIILVNLLVFGAMLATGCQSCPDTARRFGAIVVIQGRIEGWWRILTSGFVHFGFAHVAANMFGLAIFGPDLERRLGRARFLALYLGAAVLGGIFTVEFGRDRFLLAAGASGGVFGLVGAWIAMLAMRGLGSGQVLPMVVYAVLALAQGATDPRIGTLAHVGGLAGGFALGLALGGFRRDGQ